MDTPNFFKLPKSDVHSHLHLGGTVEKLRLRYPEVNISIPDSYNGLEDMINFIYGTLNKIMVTGEDVINFMEIAIEAAIGDNVSVLEASVDAGLARFFDNSIETVVLITEDLIDAYKSDIDFRPDLGINKDLPLEKVYSDGVFAIKSGVFKGIDIYGKEADQDIMPFQELFAIAKEYGLKTKAHIGEFSDHHSINDVIKTLQPDELQHGIRAVDSEKTMDLILKNDIRLNICPQSNLSLGAVSSLAEHPIRKLFDYGIKVTVSTDDLLLFGKTNTDQLTDLYNAQLFSSEEIEEIIKNGF